MQGFVATPSKTADLMVERLFRRVPDPEDVVLDPGCGDGALIQAIIRWCERRRCQLPHIVGVEREPTLAATARTHFAPHSTVSILTGDFLSGNFGSATGMGYDFIIGNPPYVPITALTDAERFQHRNRFESASGRFDLYLLFFEQALKQLIAKGRLVFITPEKFLYVESARPLRTLLTRRRVEEIRFLDERTFGGLVTYPTITTVVNSPSIQNTRVVYRDNAVTSVRLPVDHASWLPSVNGHNPADQQVTLGEICLRISCGVATGADSVFVRRTEELAPELLAFAHQTLAGRELDPSSPTFSVQHSMLIPYSCNGELLDESSLGPLKAYLEAPARRVRLLRRTCVRRKPWYAFHETPPLPLILEPKILCKDITARPRFWVSTSRDLVPRHSVYYIVPKDVGTIEALCEFLNSAEAEEWLFAHCQRAANGFIRLQSHVLKRLPIPADIAKACGSQRSVRVTRARSRGSRVSNQLALGLGVGGFLSAAKS